MASLKGDVITNKKECKIVAAKDAGNKSHQIRFGLGIAARYQTSPNFMDNDVTI